MTLQQFLTITDHYSIGDVRRALVQGLHGERPRTPDDFQELYSAAFARLRLVAQRIRRRSVRHRHPMSWIERAKQ